MVGAVRRHLRAGGVVVSAASRRRGHDCERQIVRYLKAEGFPDACTTRAKLGHDGATAPGDIDFHPLVCLEAKDVAGSAWPTWCRQAAAEARPGMVPVVVRRTRGIPYVGQWEIRAEWCGWVEAFGVLPAQLTGMVREGVEVDGHAWLVASMADLVAAVRGVDQ